MTSTQAAREPFIQRARRKAESMLGPAGVFFKGFLKHPGMVGAIVPSSGRTIERVLSKVDW
ncbi:MAG: methyltransferase, partial [Novosphingobium sp.]